MYAIPKTVEVDIWPFKVDNLPTSQKRPQTFYIITSNTLTLLVLIPNDETMHKFFRIIILYIALASPAILWAQESFTNRYKTIYITMNEGFPIILLMISTKTGKASFGFPCREVDYPDTTAMNSSTSLRLPHIAGSRATSYAKSTKTTFSGFGLYQKGALILST